MSFQQGLSGLNGAAKALDVTSNNVANSATVGFKSAAAHFSDVFASSLSGSGAGQVGIGTSVGAVQQQFTQGNITTTNNPLDISINGGGFFRMSDSGSVSYSRSGQFHLDDSGFIIDDQGRNLTGYPVIGGVLVPSAPVPLQLSSANQDPVATGPATDPSAGVKASLNFDSRVVAPALAFNKDNPATYNFSTATPIYDSLGNAHTLTIYTAKTAPVAPAASTWNIYASVDGTDPAFSGLTTSTVSFNSSGQLVPTATMPGNGIVGAAVNLTNVMAALTPPQVNIAAPVLSFNIDFATSTQFGSASGTNSLNQNGYTSGRLTGVSVGDDGIIRGNYSNGQSRDLGQVVLANFTNPNGLISKGGNQWQDSTASGSPAVGAPNTGTLGVLQSAAIEESNVDLTAELVNMITEQRNYQANAQSIKTQDQILQTLVNLR